MNTGKIMKKTKWYTGGGLNVRPGKRPDQGSLVISEARGAGAGVKRPYFFCGIRKAVTM